MVPFVVKSMCRIVLIAGLVAFVTVAGCEAARPGKTAAGPKADAGAFKKGSGKGGLLKMPSLGGRDYATTYTILCMQSKGPEGAKIVQEMAKGLQNVRGLDPSLVKVDSDGQKSRLFYGAYKGLADKMTDRFVAPAKAKEEATFIRGMECKAQLGTITPFTLAQVVEMPTPDVGPAEWNLNNAPGMYTLQICYCFDKPGLPNHKEVAVAICKALREQGEEAWYLHNDRVSVVTVGHFDESAIQKDASGNLSYSPAVIALQNKREEFKYNTESLLKVTRLIDGKRIGAPSMLIYIKEPANDPAKPAVRAAANPLGHR